MVLEKNFSSEIKTLAAYDTLGACARLEESWRLGDDARTLPCPAAICFWIRERGFTLTKYEMGSRLAE